MNAVIDKPFTMTHASTEHLDDVTEVLGIIGRSATIQNIIRDIGRIAPSDVAVLIIGESGTGKDLVAKAIHRLSARKNRPMIIVNSGAIAEGILESELFGHERGAFTGAVSERKGYFESANGGTIFLDEIGDMPPATQVKLLRVLESGEFMKVGGSAAKKTDVRVIAATNRNLDWMVRRGEFRKDLYYRLRAIQITLPPLRARQEDIPVLIDKFMKDFADASKGAFEGFSNEAMQGLVNYRWPGNVRELKNVVESLITLKRGHLVTGDDVREHLQNFRDVDELNESDEVHLPVALHVTPEQAERELLYRTLLSLKQDVTDIKHFLASKFGLVGSGGHTSSVLYDKKMNDNKVVATEVYNVDEAPTDKEMLNLVDVEKDMIIKALKKFDGKRSQAAKSLGLSERTLYRKIKEYDLDL
jgi:transcriptional regulator with PAS, ATPase and Fis domain